MTDPILTAPSYTCMIQLRPPRPTFFYDANERERALMQDHSAYWRDHMAQGLVVAFGPVLHPDGPFGIGLLRAADAAAVQEFLAKDPALSGNIGLVAETFPMAALFSTPAKAG